jgi:hypothetical protein
LIFNHVQHQVRHMHLFGAVFAAIALFLTLIHPTPP